MKQPQAQPAYRVPRSHLDDLYVKDKPPAPVRPAVGTVTDVSDTDRTIEVDDAGETITVVCLGTKPDVGDEIDYYVVDGLAYTPEPSVGAGALVIVHHGDDGDVARPDAIWVLWLGLAEPVNAKPYDAWEEANI